MEASVGLADLRRSGSAGVIERDSSGTKASLTRSRNGEGRMVSHRRPERHQPRRLLTASPTRRAGLYFVQETGDLRLQHGSVVRFARVPVLDEPAPHVSRQIIPFPDKGGTQTLQSPALHVAQIAGFIGQRPRDVLGSAFLVPTVESGFFLRRLAFHFA